MYLLHKSWLLANLSSGSWYNTGGDQSIAPLIMPTSPVANAPSNGTLQMNADGVFHFGSLIECGPFGILGAGPNGSGSVSTLTTGTVFLDSNYDLGDVEEIIVQASPANTLNVVLGMTGGTTPGIVLVPGAILRLRNLPLNGLFAAATATAGQVVSWLIHTARKPDALEDVLRQVFLYLLPPEALAVWSANSNAALSSVFSDQLGGIPMALRQTCSRSHTWQEFGSAVTSANQVVQAATEAPVGVPVGWGLVAAVRLYPTPNWAAGQNTVVRLSYSLVGQ